MKHIKDAALTSLCAEVRPGDGIPPQLLKRQKENRKRKQHQSRPVIDRHALQYCKEAKRSLEGELTAITGDESMNDWSVVSVEPLPGGSVLLVIVSAPFVTQDTIAAMESRLGGASGLLRAAIAGNTHRKRVPHLRFRVVPAEL
jgi:hypothetical protein